MNENYAYDMGRDAAENGPNTTNCNFSVFSKPEFTKAWEKGQEDYYRQNPSKRAL